MEEERIVWWSRGGVLTMRPDHFWRRGPPDKQSVPSNHYHNRLIDVSVIITFFGIHSHSTLAA